MAGVLSDDEVAAWLATHTDWRREGNEIRRSVECASFSTAIDLVTRIAAVAEERDHHPDIDIRWRTLHLALSTHSAGGLTRKDLELAETIDGLVAG
jgi:4a-hydroxytetrahydrobiopterin dehydratase